MVWIINKRVNEGSPFRQVNEMFATRFTSKYVLRPLICEIQFALNWL